MPKEKSVGNVEKETTYLKSVDPRVKLNKNQRNILTGHQKGKNIHNIEDDGM